MAAMADVILLFTFLPIRFPIYINAVLKISENIAVYIILVFEIPPAIAIGILLNERFKASINVPFVLIILSSITSWDLLMKTSDIKKYKPIIISKIPPIMLAMLFLSISPKAVPKIIKIVVITVVIVDIIIVDLKGILIFAVPHDTPNIILSKLLDTLSSRLNNIFNLIPPILYLMNILITLSLKLYTNILSISTIFVDLAKLL